MFEVGCVNDPAVVEVILELCQLFLFLFWSQSGTLLDFSAPLSLLRALRKDQFCVGTRFISLVGAHQDLLAVAQHLDDFLDQGNLRAQNLFLFRSVDHCHAKLKVYRLFRATVFSPRQKLHVVLQSGNHI